MLQLLRFQSIFSVKAVFLPVPASVNLPFPLKLDQHREQKLINASLSNLCNRGVRYFWSKCSWHYLPPLRQPREDKRFIRPALTIHHDHGGQNGFCFVGRLRTARRKCQLKAKLNHSSVCIDKENQEILKCSLMGSEDDMQPCPCSYTLIRAVRI